MMDMSMPSYDDVKGTKASIENAKSLSIQEPEKKNVDGVTTKERKQGGKIPSAATSDKKIKEKKINPMEYTF